jgi:hypothetical protein
MDRAVLREHTVIRLPESIRLTISLTVTDNDEEAATSAFQYVVVYDPSAGFVTGGGWIESPGGAYVAEPSLTGKASFGFNSQAKTGICSQSKFCSNRPRRY